MCPTSHSNPSFNCLTKLEDVKVSGPFLTLEGLPTSSVALPAPPGYPVPLVGHPQHWKHAANAARAAGCPGLQKAWLPATPHAQSFPLFLCFLKIWQPWRRGSPLEPGDQHLCLLLAYPPGGAFPLIPFLSSISEVLVEPSHSLTLQPSMATIPRGRKARFLILCFCNFIHILWDLVKIQVPIQQAWMGPESLHC